MAAYDDLPIQRIVVVGLLSIAITIITVLGVQVLYFGMQNYVDEGKLAESTYREGLESLTEQTKRISRVGVDEDSGRITIDGLATIDECRATSMQAVTYENRRRFCSPVLPRTFNLRPCRD